MSGSRDHGRQHVRFRFNKQLHAHTRDRSLDRSFETFQSRYDCQSRNGRRTVGQKGRWARARAFEIGGLLYIASKRVFNVVVRVIQAFWIAVERENLLSSLVESFHSRARTNLNNTKGFIDIRIEISFLYDYSDQSRVVLSSNSSSWRDLRY